MTTAGQTDDKGPLTIRFKGVNITPGGFIEAETVNRQRAMSEDINTQFNAIPFGGNAGRKNVGTEHDGTPVAAVR